MLEDSNFLEYQSKGKRGQELLTIGHINYLYLLYVLSILPACMYIPLKARIGFGSPETGVLGSCEPPRAFTSHLSSPTFHYTFQKPLSCPELECQTFLPFSSPVSFSALPSNHKVATTE